MAKRKDKKHPVSQPPSIGKANSARSDFSEIGVAGVKMPGGTGRNPEEYDPDLQGEKGRRAYQDMEDNCSLVGAFFFIVNLLIQRTEWKAHPPNDVKAADEEPALERAFFMESVIDDMSHTLSDGVSWAMTMLSQGWSWQEIVFKRRMGPEHPDPAFRSQYRDGLIGIRKLAFRPQRTKHRFELDDEGEVQGLWQRMPSGAVAQEMIPIERSLFFRAGRRYNPEGRSILRPAYREWLALRGIDEIELTAIDRDLTGLPIAYVPQEVFDMAEAGDPTALNKYLTLVRDVRLNTQAGVVLPSDSYTDGEDNPTNIRQVSLELLSTNGTRVLDIDKAAKRREYAIARVLAAEFLMLGLNGVGSFSMHEDKTELFLMATQGWLHYIATVYNRHLVPRLWRQNRWSPETMPTLEPGKVKQVDLGQLGEAIRNLTIAGMELFPDENMEAFIRQEAGWPAKAA